MITKKCSCLMVCVLFFLCFSINLNLSKGADSITANQSLYGNQTIISAGETFELGFFSPGNSSKYYVGIWYKKVSPKTVVWVANREKPISDMNSAELKILDGNLVLMDKSQVSFWSTNVNSTTSNSVVATLGDNGNLVLRDGSEPKSSEGFWQSFDNPTDTYLPGGKISYNKLTKKKTLFISWINSEDPAPGLFSTELDQNRRQYITMWNRTEEYWASGPWNGHIFSLTPEMRRDYIFNFSYEDNDNESYFTYWLYDPSIISRSVMDVTGQIKQLTWSENLKEWTLFYSQPKQQCEVYAYCGAFGTCNQNSLPFCYCLPGFKQKSENDWNLKDYSGGCVREIDLLQCGNGSTSTGGKDKFLLNPQVRLPKHSQSVMAGSAGECESVCLNNCSCTAYSYDGNACLVWNGELMDLQQLSENDGSGRNIYVRLAASAPQLSSNKKNKGSIIGAVVGSVAVFMVLLAIVGVVIWRRQRRGLGTTKALGGSLVAFGYKDLQIATKNFSNKLGGGGFGSVFKGTLPDSTVIAVKKLDSISQGEKQFRTEVSTIGTIQHVNLVRLHGICSEGDRKLLVYEYMENGSLDSHLFNVKESKVLDWKTRYQIMLGIARGLSYLHEKCRDCIIHCDIKPENILLDAEFCPKVADFGLAKLVGRDFSRVLTTLRGTRGYLAPEWISGVAITAKADVYSYGMMLFEFISGRRNSEQSEDGMVKFFPSFAASVTAEGGDVLGLLDPALDGNADAEEVSKICKVACWCIQDEENIRPSMGHVVQILEGVIDVHLPPIPKSLKLFVESQEHIMFFIDSSSG
ncbi:G-type lectin S-receptor-like serine/threonine-protein kinase [Abeliophyllum distichum]|uniref:Receptor-like serine/threonine-protein kinase n=1 Tax=Abeliophyllum distichum TaxID=126358 RepID=A0ABD1UJB2_9LAMI